MPFNDEIGRIFNCGFCRTAVYECLRKKSAKISNKKKSEGSCTDPNPQTVGTSQSEEVAGETPDNSKVCAQPDAVECFKALFSGPQFAVGDTYFVRVSTSAQSLFERHAQKVRMAFNDGFHSATLRNNYVEAFSSATWEALPQCEKSCHSLSNCVACAAQFEQLQKQFPLKPLFCPPQDENAYVNVSAVCRQVTGKPLAELVANLGFKRPSEVEQTVDQAKKRCVLETQKQCAAECSKRLERTTLPAILTTDTSKSRYRKVRMQQYFNPPRTGGATKKRYPVRPHECDNYPELCETLKTWDPASTPASEIAREFNVSGTDSSHRIRLLALKNTPGIVDMVPKPKSTKMRFENSVVLMGAPPDPRRLAAIEQSMVDNGELKEGVPCFPVKVRRFRHGALVEIDAHGRKYPLVEVRQSLLNANEQFMRLHSDSEIASMTRDDVLSILQLGAGYSMHQFANATVDALRAHLARFERNRSIWIWHDHSSLASHGVLAVMVGVVFDSIVFKTDDEVGQSVQEYIEEGAIHMLAHCSSTLEDEAILIPERLAELDGITDEITSSSGIKIVDTLRFFKGDKPAAQFEAGVSCGGNYPCVGCICHRDRFADFPHAVTCEQRSFRGTQEVALAGHFGRVPGKIRFYDELTSEQLRLELEKRAVKDYPTGKKGRLETLKHILCGVQRVPSLLLFAPEAALSELHLSSYHVLACEPLHDLKGYLAAVLKKLPSIMPQCALKSTVSECLALLFKKAKVYGSDLRSALVEVAHILAKSVDSEGPRTLSEFITCLVQVSRILYSKDSDRSPKQCLHFYNCAFMLHQLHCELFGESTSTYFHALLIHCPVQHEVACSRSTNTEGEERIFKSAEAAAKCTDRKPENMLPVILKRLQLKMSNKTSNPLQSLKVENSKISLSAAKLPPYKGTVFTMDFVRKCAHAYQAHLQRIGHFLVLGEGVWWHRTADGSVHFHDGSVDADFSDTGPELLHFRNAEVLDALKRSSSCWQEAFEKKVPLPVDVIRCYDICGDVTAIADTGSCSDVMEVSFETSFTLPTLPPPQSSTPVRQHEAGSVEPLQPAEEHEFVQEGDECAQEEQSAQPITTEGFVDMAIAEEVSETPDSGLQSSLCKAVARLLGVTPELQEFDHVRSLCKSQQSKQATPVMLQRHVAFAGRFRKLMYLHKRSLEHKLSEMAPSDTQYNLCVKDVKSCQQLICHLH